jgi:hypothetical protein
VRFFICGTRRKVAGSRPNEVRFSIYLILPAALGPGVRSFSNRNEYRKHRKKKVFLGSKVLPVRGADNLTAIYEPTVSTMWDLNISQPYRHPLLVTGIALLYFCVKITGIGGKR